MRFDPATGVRGWKINWAVIVGSSSSGLAKRWGRLQWPGIDQKFGPRIGGTDRRSECGRPASLAGGSDVSVEQIVAVRSERVG